MQRKRLVDALQPELAAAANSLSGHVGLSAMVPLSRLLSF
jgi:hypothetical protein